MSAVSDLLAQAKLPERAVPVCLRGDLAQQLADLDAVIGALQAELSAEGGDRIGDPRYQQLTELGERYAALEADMKAATTQFRLRALNPSKKAALILAHPPRDNNPHDRTFGANRDTYFPALVRACLVDPLPESDAEFEQLLDVMSDGTYQELIGAAAEVTGSSIQVPFSRAAWAITPRSSEGSE